MQSRRHLFSSLLTLSRKELQKGANPISIASLLQRNFSLEMGKIRVDVCLISARGLRRTSSLWKYQWFAVGWINPDSKYCTKIDSSGNVNPVWNTKFSTTIDLSESNLQELALNVEVYSREPFFLRERLLGSATVVLKDFLDKYSSSSDVTKPVEEVGSFQLRKKNSNKPVGFVDVSIRVSEDREEPSSSYLGAGQGLKLTDNNGGVNIGASGYGYLQPEGSHVKPLPQNFYGHPPVGGASYAAASGPSYPPPQTPLPPPPPPPSNVGYISNLFPMASSYISMPSSVAPPGRGLGPGFGMGVGAGALAAGAVIFGDDFMSGFDIAGASRDASATISTYPF